MKYDHRRGVTPLRLPSIVITHYALRIVLITAYAVAAQNFWGITIFVIGKILNLQTCIDNLTINSPKILF